MCIHMIHISNLDKELDSVASMQEVLYNNPPLCLLWRARTIVLVHGLATGDLGAFLQGKVGVPMLVTCSKGLLGEETQGSELRHYCGSRRVFLVDDTLGPFSFSECS